MDVSTSQIHCKHCGSLFTPNDPRQTTCRMPECNRERNRIKMGLWRADNPDKVEESRIAARTPLSDRECLACGKSYSPSSAQQKICGDPNCRRWLKHQSRIRKNERRRLAPEDATRKLPFRMPRPPLAGHIWCGPCAAELPIDQFDRSQHGRQIGICKTCSSFKKQAHKYGVTIEFLRDLERTQNGCCAICGQPESKPWRLSLDHDHSCCPGKTSCGKCVRGLVCDAHNRMLGLAKDDIAILESAIAYLKSYQ